MVAFRRLQVVGLLAVVAVAAAVELLNPKRITDRRGHQG